MKQLLLAALVITGISSGAQKLGNQRYGLVDSLISYENADIVIYKDRHGDRRVDTTHGGGLSVEHARVFVNYDYPLGRHIDMDGNVYNLGDPNEVQRHAPNLDTINAAPFTNKLDLDTDAAQFMISDGEREVTFHPVQLDGFSDTLSALNMIGSVLRKLAMPDTNEWITSADDFAVVHSSSVYDSGYISPRHKKKKNGMVQLTSDGHSYSAHRWATGLGVDANGNLVETGIMKPIVGLPDPSVILFLPPAHPGPPLWFRVVIVAMLSIVLFILTITFFSPNKR